MEYNKATIDVNKAFSCRLCKQLAIEPLISECCQVIICQKCTVPNFKCPQCQNSCKVKKSKLLSSIYQCVQGICPYNCNAQLYLSQLQKHIEMCPQALIQCLYCKTTVKLRALPLHLGETHIQECNRLLNSFQKDTNNLKVSGKPEEIIPKIQPFKFGTVGTVNMDPRLGLKGRISCGKPLPEELLTGRHSASYNPFVLQPKENCSTQFGSCDRCMEMDVERLGLSKKYLLNLDGRICFYVAQKRKVACGCSNGAKTCNQQLQCAPCRKLLDLIQRGFYKKCIQ